VNFHVVGDSVVMMLVVGHMAHALSQTLVSVTKVGLDMTVTSQYVVSNMVYQPVVVMANAKLQTNATVMWGGLVNNAVSLSAL